MTPGARRNAIGSRGEVIFTNILTKFHGSMPLFRPQFLGEKWPVIDFLVELEGSWKKRRPFFFVQAKTTVKGYTGAGQLKIHISEARAKAMRNFRVPVYLAGIDMIGERVFLAAALGPRVGKLTNMHTGGELTAQGRSDLYEEVRAFWSAVSYPNYASKFIEPSWK